MTSWRGSRSVTRPTSRTGCDPRGTASVVSSPARSPRSPRRARAAGDRLGALAYAQRWLSVDHLHEPAHRAIIRLHASMGDRGAALSQYRECVRTLSRELGVDPLAETTRLYEAVLRGSYEVPPREPGPTKASCAPPPPPFVGRAADLAVLRAQYAAVESDGRVVLVEGEPGIGKTRLAVELLTGLRREQARVAGRARLRGRGRSRVRPGRRDDPCPASREAASGWPTSTTARSAKPPVWSPSSCRDDRSTRRPRSRSPAPRSASSPESGTRSSRRRAARCPAPCSSTTRSGRTTRPSAC